MPLRPASLVQSLEVILSGQNQVIHKQTVHFFALMRQQPSLAHSFRLLCIGLLTEDGMPVPNNV